MQFTPKVHVLQRICIFLPIELRHLLVNKSCAYAMSPISKIFGRTTKISKDVIPSMKIKYRAYFNQFLCPKANNEKKKVNKCFVKVSVMLLIGSIIEL